MTIKDICNNEPKCKNCSFHLVCPIYVGSWNVIPGDFNNTDNDLVTRAIIETSRKLLEDLE